MLLLFALCLSTLILTKSFIISQFNYCPLIWMIHSSTFKDLLSKDKSVTIHQRNLQQLATEIFKVIKVIAPIILNETFTFVKNNTYNLRSGMHLSRVNVHFTQYDAESIGNLGLKIWNHVPVHMKDLKALTTFKNQIKKWIPKSVPSVQSICSTS